MENRFCVIGDKRITTLPVTRTFLPTQHEAVDHAGRLLLNERLGSYYGNPKGQLLFVTEIVGVVMLDPVLANNLFGQHHYMNALSFVHPDIP